MATKIGEVRMIICSESGEDRIWKDVFFKVWYLKNAHRGYEERFNVIHPSYWVIMNYQATDYNIGGLGRMLQKIKELERLRKGRVIKNTLPTKIQKIAKKEEILYNLEK